MNMPAVTARAHKVSNSYPFGNIAKRPLMTTRVLLPFRRASLTDTPTFVPAVRVPRHV